MLCKYTRDAYLFARYCARCTMVKWWNFAHFQWIRKEKDRTVLIRSMITWSWCFSDAISDSTTQTQRANWCCLFRDLRSIISNLLENIFNVLHFSSFCRWGKCDVTNPYKSSWIRCNRSSNNQRISIEMVCQNSTRYFRTYKWDKSAYFANFDPFVGIITFFVGSFTGGMMNMPKFMTHEATRNMNINRKIIHKHNDQHFFQPYQMTRTNEMKWNDMKHDHSKN